VTALRAGIEKLFAWISAALLIVLALEVLVGIVFRAAGHPLAWYDEVASVLLAWVTYYGSALAALKRAHIGFPGLVNGLPRGGRIIALVVREVAVIGFFVLLAVWGVHVLDVLAGETLVTVDIPVRVTQSVIPIGAALFILAELLNLPGQIAWAIGRPAAPPPTATDAAKELSQ
jgi:TRAP-type C4-dicarboxylate transport system permease small subunit